MAPSINLQSSPRSMKAVRQLIVPIRAQTVRRPTQNWELPFPQMPVRVIARAVPRAAEQRRRRLRAITAHTDRGPIALSRHRLGCVVAVQPPVRHPERLIPGLSVAKTPGEARIEVEFASHPQALDPASKLRR